MSSNKTLDHCFILNFPEANAKQINESLTASYIYHYMKKDNIDRDYKYSNEFLEDDSLKKYLPKSKIYVTIPRGKDGNHFGCAYVYISDYDETNIINQDFKIIPFHYKKSQLENPKIIEGFRFTIQRSWLKKPSERYEADPLNLITTVPKYVKVSNINSEVRKYIKQSKIDQYDKENKHYPFITYELSNNVKKFFLEFDSEEDAATVFTMMRKFSLHVPLKSKKNNIVRSIMFYVNIED